MRRLEVAKAFFTRPKLRIEILCDHWNWPYDYQIRLRTMAGLTPTSSRDVQLDNAKGVYTMHIDSRNLDSNSLLGKALKNIDADGDGEIEQVSLNIIWKADGQNTYSPPSPTLFARLHPRAPWSRSSSPPRTPPAAPPPVVHVAVMPPPLHRPCTAPAPPPTRRSTPPLPRSPPTAPRRARPGTTGTRSSPIVPCTATATASGPANALIMLASSAPRPRVPSPPPPPPAPCPGPVQFDRARAAHAVGVPASAFGP